jgi:3-hydroxyacyl-[acyl-carrier-protein] dehydratase
MLSIQEIMEIIPHRPPFLLIDRILELDERHAIGIKQVTINEPFFAGHFPGNPLMPGVLQIEALAQVGAVAVLHQPAYRGKLAVFARIENVRFRKPVVPGDTLELEVQLVELRGRIGKGHGVARVGQVVVSEGDFTFALVDPPRQETASPQVESPAQAPAD